MDARYFTSSLLTCLLIAGCQSGGNTELMEREMRLQEDRIYYLEDELTKCCKAMQECQQENEALRNGQAVTKSSKPAKPSTAPTPPAAPGGAIPKVELEMPSMPGGAPMPGPAAMFTPAKPSDANQASTARIVRPGNRPALPADDARIASQAAPPQAGPPRMRFATVVDESDTAPINGGVVSPVPQTAVAPRRPQWSPYR